MGYLKIIIAILIWSSLGIFVRKTGLPTVGNIFYPALFAGLLQSLLLLAKGRLKKQKRPDNDKKNTLLLLLTPICFLVNMYFFYFAFTHTTIANAVLTHYTAPIFVALIAPIFLREKIHKITWIAIVLSSFGLWMILRGQASDGRLALAGNESAGIIAGVLSGFAYAWTILIVRKIVTRYSALFIVFFQNIVVSLLLLPFVLDINISLKSLLYVLIMGLVHSTVAPLLYVDGLKSVKAHEASILGYFEPVGAVLLALIFLHEFPGVKSLLGGVLILYSGYIIISNRKK